MVKDRIRAWVKTNNDARMPSKILYYRDGVGDGYVVF